MNILISMRLRQHDAYAETQSAISHDWLDFCAQWQLQPILIANKQVEHLSLSNLHPQGLILTGGGDPIAESNTRNDTELFLVEYALSHRLPILAVCRGFQFLNQFFGGAVLSQCCQVGAHALHVEHSLAMAIQDTPVVNSYHDDGILQSDLSQELVALAHDPDGFVEAYHHPHQPIWGVQWHPERANPQAQALDAYIINQWKQACDSLF